MSDRLEFWVPAPFGPIFQTKAECKEWMVRNFEKGYEPILMREVRPEDDQDAE